MPDDIVEESTESLETVASPWYNSDTVSASFMFASSIASAAAEHFTYLASLSRGQSHYEWDEDRRSLFETEVTDFITKLPESGDDD